MEEHLQQDPTDRKRRKFFLGGYGVAVPVAVGLHLAFFALLASFMSGEKALAPAAPKTIKVTLASPGNDPGSPEPKGLENAPELPSDQQAADHVDLPEMTFDKTDIQEPTPDINVAMDIPAMPEMAFRPSAVDTSLFDMNMPEIPSPAKRKPATSSGNKLSGGKPAAVTSSRGTASGQQGGSGGGSSGGGGGDVSVPRYKYTPLPPYPDKARREKREGTVLISIEVDENGTPVSVSVRKSSGFPELDEATIQHVKSRWKFHPAIIDGKTAGATVIVPVVFNLKNS